MNAYECHRVYEIYELKWAGERYADEYRKKVSKERRDNPDALIAKDKEILDAAEKLAKKEQSRADIEKRLKESAALLTRAMSSSLCRSFAPSLFASSLFRSIHRSLHNYSFFYFLLSGYWA